VSEEAKPLFLEGLAAVREMLPEGHDYGAWRRLSPATLEDRYALVFGHLTETDERRDAFLHAELRLSQGYLLVKHLDECRAYADEVIFYQRLRKELGKTLPGARPGKELERAVRDLVDDSVESQGVVDIFKVAGIERPDISILDDAFLQTFKDRPLPDLRLRLLAKLVADEIQARQRRNLAQAKSFKDLLEQTLQRYHNRLIDAAAVIKAMIEIRGEMDRAEDRAAQLGLEADELAFYDAVVAQREAVYGVEFMRDLIHEVVQVIKRTVKVDWTEPHRDDVKAAVRAAVRRVLRSRGVRVEDFERFVTAVMAQAEALFANWPQAA
jgi:type I restriction enzyme R subunit